MPLPRRVVLFHELSVDSGVFLSAGQTVLIHAAAGGVGTFALQFAKWEGAHVIGTASSRNQDFLRELGIDQVIDYRRCIIRGGIQKFCNAVSRM